MKPTLVALALSSAMLLACVTIPSRLATDNDPANPRAQEAPIPKPTDTLASDPPPQGTARSSTPDAGMGMKMDRAAAADGGTP